MASQFYVYLDAKGWEGNFKAQRVVRRFYVKNPLPGAESTQLLGEAFWLNDKSDADLLCTKWNNESKPGWRVLEVGID